MRIAPHNPEREADSNYAKSISAKHRNARGAASINSASGTIRVGIAEGTEAWLDLHSVSGHVSSELNQTKAPTDGAGSVGVQARTLSGDIMVTRSHSPHRVG